MRHLDIEEILDAIFGLVLILVIAGILFFIGFVVYKRLQLREREITVLEKMAERDTTAIHKVFDFSKQL